MSYTKTILQVDTKINNSLVTSFIVSIIFLFAETIFHFQAYMLLRMTMHDYDVIQNILPDKCEQTTYIFFLCTIVYTGTALSTIARLLCETCFSMLWCIGTRASELLVVYVHSNVARVPWIHHNVIVQYLHNDFKPFNLSFHKLRPCSVRNSHMVFSIQTIMKVLKRGILFSGILKFWKRYLHS